MIGRQLAQYRIVELIGSGGMGVVYRGHDERLGRDVALKVLPTGAFADPERRKRLRSEAAALSRLNHPNIATVHDFNTVDDIDFIVMEHIRGETLEARLRSGPLPPSDIVQLGSQIVEGVAAAHERDIIHRDLKPGNVLITGDGRAKILDFGLAKLIAATAATSERTQEQIVSRGMSGTLPYMAPEQLVGGHADHRSDIYAIGVVLYEMATGRRPFDGAMRHTLPSQPSEMNPSLPPALSFVIMRCLENDPDLRFQSARDLLIALRQATSSPTAAWDPQNQRSGASRSGVRRTAGVAILVAMAIAAGVVVWRTMLSDRPDGTSRPIRSVAILPFRTDAADAAFAGIGVADAIVTKISRTAPAAVRPTSAVRPYTSPEVDPIRAGRELDVDAVIEGTMRRSGDRVRVGLNLVRVMDGRSLWSDNFDANGADIFAVEDAIAERVLGALDVQLSSADRRSLSKRYTSSAEARDEYTRAMVFFDRRVGDPANLGQSIDRFRRAIEHDPNYALAHANLGYAYLWMGLFVRPEDPRWLAMAKAELKRAEEIDPSLPDIHIARHDLFWSASEGFRIDDAMRELMRAQTLDPSRAHSEMATLLYHLGLREGTIRELRRATAIHPTSQVNRHHYIEGFALVGDYEESLAAAKRFRMKPNVFALLSSGRLEEADKRITEILATNKDDVIMNAAAGRLAALRGNRREAERRVSDAMRFAVRGNRAYHHATLEAAMVYAILGDAKQSVRYLEETAGFGMPILPLFEQHPHLQGARSSREFDAFLRDLRPRWQRYVAAAPVF